MNRFRVVPIVVVAMLATGSVQAQKVLRPGPSGRATSEVTLAYPRPPAATAATPGTATAGAANAPAPASTPAAMMPMMAAAPAEKPLVIRLDYGQPHLRGRPLHTDSLVPYDKAWRLGANAATTLTTDVDLVIGGTPLAKGTYVLYALPGRSAWKLIIQRGDKQSAMQYSEADDIARVDLRHARLATPVESLTMWLIPSREPGPARGELRFAWGTDQLSADWSIK